MNGRVTFGFACAALLSAALFVSPASAQGFGGGGYNGSLGLGFYNYNSSNYGINQQIIPYYALFPPVYYSYPVARPYGYSPFAYPPGVMTPEVAPSKAGAALRNPFVPQPAGAQATADRSASVAKTYYNPFVVPGAVASSATSAPAAAN